MGNTLDGVNTEVEDVPTVDDVGSSSASGPGAAGDEVGLSGPVAVRELSPAEKSALGDLVRQSRAEGVALTGPDGLLKALTKAVLDIALEEEMTEHLGYDEHAAAGRGTGNSRNGSRTKKVVTDACGEVEIEVPRDRNGTFDPVIVGKSKRRVTDVDRVVLSLYAKGLTTARFQLTSLTCMGCRWPRTPSPGSLTG